MVDLVGFDSTALMNYYTARINVRGASSAASQPSGTGFENYTPYETPWSETPPDKGIANRLAELRGRTSFFDPKADVLKQAEDDPDIKNLFSMYEALRRLRVLAEYAADDNTPSGILKSLNERFQGGLTEVGDFLKDTEFNEATVLLGKKSDDVTSRATGGKPDYSYIGRTAVIGGKDDPVQGLNGDEVFTISLTKGLNSDDITVDLSNITGDVTLQKIIDLANDQISAITYVDGDGETQQRYRSRLTIESLSDSRHALKVRGFLGEDVVFSAAASEPTLTIAGTVKHSGLDAISEGYLVSLGDLNTSDPTSLSRTMIEAYPPGSLDLAAKEAEANKDEENYVAPETVKASSEASAVTTDVYGNTFVVGTAQGDVGDQFYQAEGQDVYLSKYDSAGKLVWSRMLGSSSESSAYGIATDADGNVVIAGQTKDNLTTTSVIDSVDSFVTKYSSDGQELFTKQMQTAATEGALDVTLDAAGDIYVSGYVKGAIDAAASPAGEGDSYVQKLSGTDGTTAYTHQFGTAGDDKAGDIAIADDGNLLVLSREGDNAILRKLDATDPTNELFSVNLGNLGTDGGLTDLVVDGTDIYVSGYTDNAGFGVGGTAQGHNGGTDGFVVKLSDNGASASGSYTSFVGSSGSDQVFSVAVDNGNAYAVGATNTGLDGNGVFTNRDGFAVKLDGSGAQQWSQQFTGGQGYSIATSVSVNTQGDSVLNRLGLPLGKVTEREDDAITSRSTVRDGDYFYVSINGGTKRKITIDADDTFKSLAKKIDRMSFLYMSARAGFGKSGDTLVIEAQRGAQIDIIAGDGERDALKGLGLEPTKIVHDRNVGASDSEEDEDDKNKRLKIWGLDLAGGIQLTDQKAAEYALRRIDSAMSTIRAVYRALNPNPLVEDLKNSKPTGTVPPHLQAQLANYQAGLTRLNSGGGGGAGILL